MTDAVCLGLDDSSAAGKKRMNLECCANRPGRARCKVGDAGKGGLQDDPQDSGLSNWRQITSSLRRRGTNLRRENHFSFEYLLQGIGGTHGVDVRQSDSFQFNTLGSGAGFPIKLKMSTNTPF